MVANDSEQSAPKSPSSAVDLEVFTRVAAAFQELDDAGRRRLLRTIATFFGLEGRSSDSPSTAKSGSFDDVLQAEKPQGSTPLFSEDRALSPKAFMMEKRPQTDIERVACLAYYLTHYRSQPNFKTLDLSKLNTEAAQIKLSNPAQAVDNASKGGFLIQATKGQKQISALGELYVQALPDRAAARDAVAHARPKRPRLQRRPKLTGSDTE